MTAKNTKYTQIPSNVAREQCGIGAHRDARITMPFLIVKEYS
jgi:hypothetical protein